MFVAQPDKSHRALQFVHLEHPKGRLLAAPLHQSETVERREGPEWTIECLPTASSI
jgi:hypothetical protein